MEQTAIEIIWRGRNDFHVYNHSIDRDGCIDNNNDADHRKILVAIK